MSQLTIFMKHRRCVKKITQEIKKFDELYGIFKDKFNVTNIDDIGIEFNIRDKEFLVDCELENIEQIYNGAIITVRTSSDSFDDINGIESPLSTLYSLGLDTTDNEVISDIDIDEDIINAIDNKLELNNIDNNEIKDQSILNTTDITNNNITINNSDDKLHDITNEYLTKINNNYIDNNSNKEIDFDRDQISDWIIPDGYHLKLVGVPYPATRQDIKRFFKGIELNDDHIFFTKNVNGNRIGETFVTFNTKKDLKLALKRNNHHIGQRYIEVKETTLDKYICSVKISKGITIMKDINKYVIKMKGFSFNCNENEIRKFIGNKLINAEIHIIYDYKNRNSGITFLTMDTEKEFKYAFGLNRKYLGRRYIKIYNSNINELRLTLAQLIGTPLPKNTVPYYNCLKMEGIPININHKIIIKFFNISSVCPIKLYVKPGFNVCYAEFKNPFECQLGLSRNQQMINGNTIYLTQVSKFELRKVIGVPNDNNNNTICNDNNNGNNNTCNNEYEYGTQNYANNINDSISAFNNNNSNNNNDCSSGNNVDNKNGYSICIRGIPFECTEQDIINWFNKSEFNIDKSCLKMLYDQKGRFKGQAFVKLDNYQQANRAVKLLNRTYIGRRYVLITLV